MFGGAKRSLRRLRGSGIKVRGRGRGALEDEEGGVEL